MNAKYDGGPARRRRRRAASLVIIIISEEGDRGDVDGSPRSGVEDECYKEPHR